MHLKLALVTGDTVTPGEAWGTCMQRLGHWSNMNPQVSEGHKWAVLSLGSIELSSLVILASLSSTAHSLPSYNPYHGKSMCNAKKCI